MASTKKLRIFPSQSGQLGINATTTVPTLGTADKTALRVVYPDVGFIAITIPNPAGIETEYYIPLFEA